MKAGHPADVEVNVASVVVVVHLTVSNFDAVAVVADFERPDSTIVVAMDYPGMPPMYFQEIMAFVSVSWQFRSMLVDR